VRARSWTFLCSQARQGCGPQTHAQTAQEAGLCAKRACD
jgi:hypothetical protein